MSVTVEWIPAAPENWRSDYAEKCEMSHGVAIHHFGWRDLPDGGRRYATIGGSIAWFRTPRPSAPTSAHILIADQRVVQMVPISGVAYHTRYANRYRLGIEHDPAWSDATYETGALISACLLRLRDLLADSNTIRGHGDLQRHPSTREPLTVCPGHCDMARYREQTRDAIARLKYLTFIEIVSQLLRREP